MLRHLDFRSEKLDNSGLPPVQTTLYDLIEAVIEMVPPEEEQLVAEVVSHLIKNRRLNI